MTHKQKIALSVVLAPVVVVALVGPAAAPAMAQAYRRLGQVFVVTSVSSAALDVDQRGSGSILNMSDGGTDEYTFDQSSATFVNQLNLSDDLKIGNGTPGVTLNGEDAYVEGTFEVDGAARFDGAVAFNGAVTGTTLNDLDGGPLYMDANQSTIQRAQTNGLATYTLPATGTLQVTTGNLRVGNGSNGTTLNGEDAYIEGTLEVDGAANLGGGVTTATITGANAETLDNGTNGFWSLAAAGLTQTVDTQNGLGFASWDRATVITSTNGTLWTVPASEKWMVHRVFCQVTTNFDCTGDDCALIIGDDTDTDGFLVLADAELQAADTEGTGWPAGFQGFTAATVGAFLDGGGWGFPYIATQTIDIDIRDASAGTNPTAGAATCWLNYTRFE